MRDRLWFFTSGRLRDEAQGRTLIGTTVPYEFKEEQRRYEAKGTFSLNPKHRFQVNYNHHDRSQINYSFNQNLTMDLRSLGTRRTHRLEGARQRLDQHHHAGTAAVGAVIDTAIVVVGEVAEWPQRDADLARFERTPRDAVRQVRREQLWKQRDDVEAHGFSSPGPSRR